MALEPYNVDATVSSLNSTGLRPHTLTGIILRLLTRAFSVAAGIQHPQLKGYIWTNNPETTKILIAPVWRWNTPGMGARPALLVKRNALRPRQLGLADGQAVIGGLNGDKIPVNEEPIAQVGVVGSHTVFALSKNPAEAEWLSTEVAIRLIQYAQAIQNEFGFNRFRVAEIGAISKLEESSEHFAVPITVAYMYMDAWRIVSESPLLKRLVLQTST